MMTAVILHNIRSSHNVGSIFRTADAAGVGKIYLSGITPGPCDRYGHLNQKLAKVSLGAENFINWERVRSIGALIRVLKKEKFKILALEQHKNSIPLFDFRPKRKEKYALIVGSEINGLPSSVLKLADKILEIPMSGRKESLNAAVAFGIAIFYLDVYLDVKRPS
jgi:23S rRNA (guanosine2251-2'-O)-methyltransferase